MKKGVKAQVAVFGSSGKMGKEIAEMLSLSSDLEPTLGISREVPEEKNFLHHAGELKEKDFDKIQVLIDFSNAGAFSKALDLSLRKKIPFVSGTTGISEKQKRDLIHAGKAIPVLWSPNMSLGIAALAKATEALKTISKYDFQIEEVHHTRKKDSPSGTALFLQNEVEKAIGKKLPPVLAIRGGGVFGEHEIRAYGENEIIRFSHVALSRRLFAEGAVTACRWILKQKKGLYQMKDVFQL